MLMDTVYSRHCSFIAPCCTSRDSTRIGIIMPISTDIKLTPGISITQDVIRLGITTPRKNTASTTIATGATVKALSSQSIIDTNLDTRGTSHASTYFNATAHGLLCRPE